MDALIALLRCWPRGFATTTRASPASQDVLRQVVVLDDAGELGIDVSGVDGDGLAFQFDGVERYFVEQAFHHGVQSPRTDVLLAFVDAEGDLGKPANTV